MIHTRHFKLLASLGLSLMVWVGQAQATIAPSGPSLTTYTFTGNCVDCAEQYPDSPSGVTATLQLQTFTPGSSVLPTNFFSFSYSGSSLFQAFTVSAFDDPVPSMMGGVFPADGGNFNTELSLSGVFRNGETSQSFVFQTTTDGSFTLSSGEGCSGFGGEEGPSAYACNVEDYGTGTWNIPEPGSLALLGLALAGLGLTRRVKRG